MQSHQATLKQSHSFSKDIPNKLQAWHLTPKILFFFFFKHPT